MCYTTAARCVGSINAVRYDCPVQGGREAILELLQQPEMCAFLSACGLSPEMLERMALAAAAQAARSAQDRSACSQTHLHN